MKVGDKIELVIPSDLGYGPNGSMPVIGPNAVLIFELELIEIVK
jgi:FKBP-type peptidyl-prolyl cis-trans isomerase FklB